MEYELSKQKVFLDVVCFKLTHLEFAVFTEVDSNDS